MIAKKGVLRHLVTVPVRETATGGGNREEEGQYWKGEKFSLQVAWEVKPCWSSAPPFLSRASPSTSVLFQKQRTEPFIINWKI
jgi:hypothetical protein